MPNKKTSRAGFGFGFGMADDAGDFCGMVLQGSHARGEHILIQRKYPKISVLSDIDQAQQFSDRRRNRRMTAIDLRDGLQR